MPNFILQIPFGDPAFDETIRLRDEILRKPLGLTFTAEQIAAEYNSIHLGCYDANWSLLGCLVLEPLSARELKMRQVAVDEPHQRKGVGKLLVSASEELARKQKYEVLTLNARETAVPFYLQLGYERVGERFVEVGIPHFRMEKRL